MYVKGIDRIDLAHQAAGHATVSGDPLRVSA
jgi:hypothetical protein